MSILSHYLHELGENRTKVMLKIKEACDLSFRKVKLLLNEPIVEFARGGLGSS